MSCERFREALSRHAAGDGIDAAAAAHLADCRACVARLELQRQLLSDVDAELERVAAIHASPALVERVIAQSHGARETAWRVRAALAGLAAAAALALTVYLRAPVPAPSPPPQASKAIPASAPSVAAVAPSRVDVPATPAAAVRRPARIAMRRPALSSTNEPPVIVRPDQVLAIARLRELLTEGLLTEEVLPPAHPHAPQELTVAPLQISDITVSDVETVGRAPGAVAEREQEKEP